MGGGKSFSAAILKFASAYAKQTVADWKLLCGAAKK
jgi:hypothetical protein